MLQKSGSYQTPRSKHTRDPKIPTGRPRQEGLEKVGRYLSERQWGTVREDYSQDGNARSFLDAGKAGAFAKGACAGQ